VLSLIVTVRIIHPLQPRGDRPIEPDRYAEEILLYNVFGHVFCRLRTIRVAQAFLRDRNPTPAPTLRY